MTVLRPIQAGDCVVNVADVRAPIGTLGRVTEATWRSMGGIARLETVRISHTGLGLDITTRLDGLWRCIPTQDCTPTTTAWTGTPR